MGDTADTRPSLLVRIRDARDGQPWSQFVDVYAPLIHGFARRHGLQEADAADLAQEDLRAVAGAVKHLEYDPPRGAFRSWLFTIVRNKLWKFLDRQARRADTSCAASPDTRIGSGASPSRRTAASPLRRRRRAQGTQGPSRQ